MKPALKILTTFVALFALVILSGCASLTNPSRLHQLDPGNSYALDLDASRRGVYVISRDHPVSICAEPAPDVAIEFVTKLLAEVKIPSSDLDAKTQAELSSRVIELAGRTQTVLFLRESLYRLCEQSLNGNLNSEQINELYQIALSTALKLAEKDLLEERKEIIESLDDPELRRIFRGILDSSADQ